LTQAGVTEEQIRRKAATATKVSTDKFTAQNVTLAAEQRNQTSSRGTIINSEKHMAAASQSKLTLKNQLSLQSSSDNCKYDEKYYCMLVS